MFAASRYATAPERRPLFNNTEEENLGRIAQREVTKTGRVQILARNRVRGGHLDVDGIDIVAAGARAEHDRPHGYGVLVVQAAITLWNLQPDESAVLTASLRGLSVGRTGAPVRGSGVFVGGAVDSGGRLVVDRLKTDAVYSDGDIAPSTPDQIIIIGGVFVVSGAYVSDVRNHGPVVVYGTNDMALDNWGTMDRWVAEAPRTTYGPSGIGVVNFGRLNELRTAAPVETFGQWRGFNVYAGTVVLAKFDRIVTHADGAVGIQISQPVGCLVVHRGLETSSRTGQSLVKGVLTMLPAIGLSVKLDDSMRRVAITGGRRTHGAGVLPLEVHDIIESLRIRGGCGADAPEASASPVQQA